MSKIGYLAAGWMVGVATVVTSALIADTLQPKDTIRVGVDPDVVGNDAESRAESM